ncbi:GNAT family N-acetyltransferase [Teredinibacter franksiae]|uniref:GNAT family N-acetyltransferase n=1 Tax=Teredinibacter franksiae TaxID=2761453 RepID=UPI0016279A14|nr:GNAT family N-acetyltransferase [Teredinibacter franksiae]
MDVISYVEFNTLKLHALLPLVNSCRVREHLVEHALFDANSLKAWIAVKLEVDAMPGCKVRGVLYNNRLAGWCGIQLDGERYEIAIVIDSKFWGLGKRVFGELMQWAKAFGHKQVYIHLLHTRRDYKFLYKIASNVYTSELLGNKFTTYELRVN